MKHIPIDKLEATIAEELGVHHNFAQVYLSGTSGARASVWQPPHPLLAIIRPTVILLQIGSNDIAKGVQPHIVVRSIESIAKILTRRYQAVVGILAILPRETHLSVTIDEFEWARNKVNYSLGGIIRRESDIIFINHKGFAESDSNVGKVVKSVWEWSRDGTHPSGFYGRALYKRSLRRALLRAWSLRFNPTQLPP